MDAVRVNVEHVNKYDPVAAAHAAPKIIDNSLVGQASNLSPQERAKANNRDLDALQYNLGYEFSDKMLLDEALCHSSFAHEHGLYVNNERLEFLGDSVLSFIVARSLYKMYPEATEGELTRMRAELVCSASIVARAESIKLPDMILIGRSFTKNGVPKSLYEDTLEAVIGAVCLDGGMSAAEKVVKKLFMRLQDHTNTDDDINSDPKSRLQVFLQAGNNELPHYELIEKTGPMHAPHFLVSVKVVLNNGLEIEKTGTGSNKKSAESAAAALMLKELENL